LPLPVEALDEALSSALALDAMGAFPASCVVGIGPGIMVGLGGGIPAAFAAATAFLCSVIRCTAALSWEKQNEEINEEKSQQRNEER
jgi:predicted membrane protein